MLEITITIGVVIFILLGFYPKTEFLVKKYKSATEKFSLIRNINLTILRVLLYLTSFIVIPLSAGLVFTFVKYKESREIYLVALIICLLITMALAGMVTRLIDAKKREEKIVSAGSNF